MSWVPTIRHLLVGVNALVLLVPLGGLFAFQLLDTVLVRQTEGRLIAQSVVIAEAWRDRLLEAQGRSLDTVAGFRHAGSRDGEFFDPVEPVLELGYDVLPAAPPPPATRAASDRPTDRAGASVAPLLARAQVFNLSGARVLDAEGCVVAASRGGPGACLGHLREVQRALKGHYAAVVRERHSDEPPPPPWSIRRRGDKRVFTAIPVLLDGEVVGVVRMSRTAVSPLEMLWAHRGQAGAVLALCVVLIPAITFFFSRSIARPVRALTDAAEAIAGGARRRPFSPAGVVPRELHILSDSLDRMTDQLTDRADYIREFASNVSHELKTPISSINGAVELLCEESDGMSEAQRERFLANIGQDAARMDRLVRGLLHLARIQNAPGASEEIALRPFLQRLLDRVPTGGCEVRVELRDAPESIDMNPDHLESALRNLLENAIEHGGGREVSLRVSAEGSRVCFRVSDAGPGIRSHDREKIFERFFTTARQSGGTGLGLAIVRAVTESRGGRVDVACEAGRTTFRLLV